MRDSMLEMYETMFRRMVLIREFEAEAERLLDRGQIFGGIHSSAGQEAVCVGACVALRTDDYMTGHHRSHGHPIAKGADLDGLMAELLGRETGVCHGNGGSMHLADFSIGSLGESSIVGSSLAIASGAGLAITLAGTTQVCLAFFGDGASNTGIFHEAVNLAAVWTLPVVFVCENNQYAVTTRHRDTSAVEHVADRASAYNMSGVVVDGQDVLAVYDAVTHAVSRARSGGGPSMIEAMTYRYGAHSYRLSTLGQRTAEEEAFWRGRDPIELFADWLLSNSHFTGDEINGVKTRAKEDVLRSTKLALMAPWPDGQGLIRDMYANPLPQHEGMKLS